VPSIFGSNHWWQNWSKTHAYVAERMFFPRSPEDIADAVATAERDGRPLRAVGGGWSFSDASLPGSVSTGRPNVHVIDAFAAALPRTVTFPADPMTPSVASVPTPARDTDAAASMVMVADPGSLETNIGLWAYTGAGKWTYGQWTYPAADPQTLTYFARKGVRPVRNPGTASVKDTDVAGSLVMFDMTPAMPAPSADWFYHGDGAWSVGITGDTPYDRGTLEELSQRGRLGGAALWSPRAAGPGEALGLLQSLRSGAPKAPQPAYVIDTRQLTSSLQQELPGILTQAAIDRPPRLAGTSRPGYLFHVEAGITIAELGELLAHQSPKMSLLAISGSPGATLGGVLSSATHGAEFQWPLLIDTVKAIHLIGPGGLHWWIEGDDSVADPHRLRRRYPEIVPERFIGGAQSVAGIAPQDWLNAAIVSMGAIGVLYSVVLVVVPQFGVHEKVVQTTWQKIGDAVKSVPIGVPQMQSLDLDTKLRLPQTTKGASRAVLGFLLDGSMNTTGIALADNRYCDLAINPNRRGDGDFDCWIGNRAEAAALPVDPQPPPTGELGDMLAGIKRVIDTDPDLIQKLAAINQLGSAWDILWNASSAATKLGWIGSASDMIDVGLDEFLTPMIAHPDGPGVAQAFLTGLLSGLLGTANVPGRSDKTGVSVGALGFPASGIMGTALEIALGPADAFGFLKTEILDRIDTARPFFGYVSIRICKPTKTLMGMQQFGDGDATHPYSVMIEIVAFATPNTLTFMRDLQQRTADRIKGGLDAMLHWGLENDRLDGGHLRSTMGLRRPTSLGISKLDTFKAVRALIAAASPSAFRPFDNWHTSRMWLDAEIVDDDPFSFQSVVRGTRKASVLGLRNTGHAPMRIVGVLATSDFRTRPLDGIDLLPNLEVGPFPAAPTEVGGVFELPVAFIAIEPGPHTGVLLVVTHADVPDSIRVIRVRLHANVDALAVSIVDPAPPQPLDFGTVRAGDTKTMAVHVHSDSTMTAGLDSYETSDADAATQLAVATIGVGPLLQGDTKAYWVSFTPDRIGAFATDLRLNFLGGALTRPVQQVTLPVVATAIGPQATLEPASLDFGTVTVAARSEPQTVTLRNIGSEPLTIASLLLGGGFEPSGQPPPSLAPGQQAALDIYFHPGADGPTSYPFSIMSNSARPPAPVELTGVGVLQAYLTATPSPVEFGSVPVGSRGPERAVVITNAGVLAVELRGFGLTGPDAAEFKIAANDRVVGDVLRPEQRARITLLLEPTTPGPKAATLEIAHDGTTSPLRIPIGGLSTRPVGLVPSTTEVDFGDVAVGSSSSRSRLALINRADGPATVTAVDLAGVDPGEFQIASEDATRAPIDPDGRCTITLVASPTAMGEHNAELTITADVPVDPVALHVVGLDVRPEWSTSGLDFGTWKVGQTSQRQEVTLHNGGNAVVLVTSVDVSGDFMVRDVVPQVMTIPPSGYKYFWVWFQPTTPGVLQGSIVVQTRDHGALPALPLTGTGV
jgi:hypothetical protein